MVKLVSYEVIVIKQFLVKAFVSAYVCMLIYPFPPAITCMLNLP